MQKQEIMQVHPNNDNGTRCTLHSCSGDETFSPSMKIEQNREFSMDDFSICVMDDLRLSLSSCNGYYHGVTKEMTQHIIDVELCQKVFKIFF
jgi:hypothetical protein